MPEGDSIFRLATELSPRLTGCVIRRVRGRLPLPSRLEGASVVSVTARGKHLLVGVSRSGPEPERFVRTHLGLHGSWHWYPNGSRWRKPSRRASLVLETDEMTFVCFDAKELDCFSASHLERHPRLSRLGPDLLSPAPDWDDIVRRVRARPADALGFVLLDQSVASGIGNVYKSEVLFLTGHLPTKVSSAVDDEEIRRIYQKAKELLELNRERRQRVTTGVRPASIRPRLWVYERSGRPCFRCEAIIEARRMHDGRPTYWCPGCQD